MNDDDKLMEQAAQLATEISPERDLWPDIEAAISAPAQPSRRTPYWVQAAAVVLLVAGSSAVTWMVASDGASVSPGTVATSLDSEFVSFGRGFELGQGFQAARSNLAADLDVELARLSPEARAEVEENLAVIRQAIAEINEALEAEPGNMMLQEMLLNSYHDELNVMRNVGGLTQNVMSRNDI